MRTRVFLSILLINMIFASCASSKISSERKQEIENKINVAVEHAAMRFEGNRIQFLDLLRNRNMVNEYSEELISSLQKNGYIEADINKLYCLEIERILLKELFNKKLETLDAGIPATTCEFYKIENVKYLINFLEDSKYDKPNLYTDVYVYDSERKNIRAFYKINYYSEYQTMTDGMNYYKVFY